MAETELFQRVAVLENENKRTHKDFVELRADLAKLFAEFKDIVLQRNGLVDKLSERVNSMEKELIRYAGGNTILVNALEQFKLVVAKGGEELRKEAEEVDQRVKDLEKLAPALRILVWIGVALGSSVVALIWALITGKAEIVFR